MLTTARWLNHRRRVKDPMARGGDPGYTDQWSKVLAHRGPYSQFRYGCDHPSDWRGPLQRCLICAPSSGVIGIDVDRETEFLASRTGQLIGRADAISTRGAGFHTLIDARAVPPQDWPRQGPIPGGDCKSAGFLPMPGCTHYSGERYEPTYVPAPVIATPQLMAAILADRADQTGRNRDGHGGGGDGGGHDGEVAAEVMRMVLRGLTEAECYAGWLKIAIPRDAAWPFELEDFQRHYSGAVRKTAKTREYSNQMHRAVMAWLSDRRVA